MEKNYRTELRTELRKDSENHAIIQVWLDGKVMELKRNLIEEKIKEFVNQVQEIIED